MHSRIGSIALACIASALLSACPTHVNELQTDHGGHSLGEWMRDYWQWQLTGAAGSGRSGDVVFLPLPAGTDPDGDMTFTGSATASMTTSEVFALPLFVWVGETYGGTMPDDDPANPTRADFVATHVVLTLDGASVLDSSHDDLSPFYFDTQHFAATIPYETPTSYGATGAIWVKGIGLLHVPLARGQHTLHLVEHNDAAGVGFDNTWTITVE